MPKGNGSNGATPGTSPRLIATQTANHSRCNPTNAAVPTVRVMASLRRSPGVRSRSASRSRRAIVSTLFLVGSSASDGRSFAGSFTSHLAGGGSTGGSRRGSPASGNQHAGQAGSAAGPRHAS